MTATPQSTETTLRHWHTKREKDRARRLATALQWVPNPRRQKRVRSQRAAPVTNPPREVRLARLIGLWPNKIADQSRAGRQRLVDRIELALRAERQRGIAGQWSYDLGRHAALLALHREEVAALPLATSEGPR